MQPFHRPRSSIGLSWAQNVPVGSSEGRGEPLSLALPWRALGLATEASAGAA